MKRLNDCARLHTDLVYCMIILPNGVIEDNDIPSFPYHPASHSEGKTLLSINILVDPVARVLIVEIMCTIQS